VIAIVEKKPVRITRVIVSVTAVTDDGRAIDRSHTAEAESIPSYAAAAQAAVIAIRHIEAFIETGDSRRPPRSILHHGKTIACPSPLPSGACPGHEE
jgi:hypothetical protein